MDDLLILLALISAIPVGGAIFWLFLAGVRLMGGGGGVDRTPQHRDVRTRQQVQDAHVGTAQATAYRQAAEAQARRDQAEAYRQHAAAERVRTLREVEAERGRLAREQQRQADLIARQTARQAARDAKAAERQAKKDTQRRRDLGLE